MWHIGTRVSLINLQHHRCYIVTEFSICWIEQGIDGLRLNGTLFNSTLFIAIIFLSPLEQFAPDTRDLPHLRQRLLCQIPNGDTMCH